MKTTDEQILKHGTEIAETRVRQGRKMQSEVLMAMMRAFTGFVWKKASSATASIEEATPELSAKR